MSILANIKKKDFQKILKNDGFTFIRYDGEHIIYINSQKESFALPSHNNINGVIFINYCRRFGKKPYEHIKSIKKKCK